jgi:ABC-type nitrate/sulfonate/bicarbonate transport system ATPase subunit
MPGDDSGNDRGDEKRREAGRIGLEGAGTGGNGLLVRIAEKSYPEAAGGRHQVLRDVSFAGTGGEVIALLAPSGAGKTSILRIVLGLDRAFSGEVRLPPGQLGVMFQEPRLLPWLTVEANLRLTGRGDAPQRAALLAELGLAGTEALFPKALSLGMARRVALARALLGRPAMLVLDEPCASLDPRSAADLVRLLVRAARRDGTLVLLSTHDLDQVLGFADRVLLLAGTPARLAADCPIRAVAPGSAGPDRMGLKEGLLARFPFLNATAADQATP